MKRRPRGFTLLEVMVALAVAAIGLVAAIKIGASSAYNAKYLQDKTFAQWVAMNRLADLQLQRQYPPLDEVKGTEKMLGREWYWKQTAKDNNINISESGINFQINGLRRVEISVYADEKRSGNALATVETLMGAP
ncbi:MAG: type II secretion system minor pseudopilin GspI [Gammaproteobacteria bacterium]|nr:type II secretion system minor pseudopilin GspI [Gammaproteobacteria bacterium]MDH5651490.1 type II secretion system minor pseudopilin GspI [Gammaproteobacteria bacterium]